MAEHIVARVLRERAQVIRVEATAETNEQFQLMMGYVASQFEAMSTAITKIDTERGASSFDPRKLGPDLPEGAHPDSPGARELYRHNKIFIRRPVGLSQQGGGGNTVMHAGSGGVVAAGGGAGGSSWMPSITIDGSRIEKAAEAIYMRAAAFEHVSGMEFGSGHARPKPWAELRETDRQNWRLAAAECLRAALEADRG